MSFRLLLVALVCGVFSSFSQATVVVSSLKEQAEGWVSSVSASYAASSSTVEKTEYKGSFRSSNNNDQRQWLMFGELEYGEVDGTKNADSQLVHSRYIRKHVVGELNFEGFVQNESDDFAKLASRRLYGGGLSWQDKRDNLALHVMLGVMDEREEHATDASQNRQLTRATSSLQLHYQLENQALLTSVLYFQPALNDFGDYRSTFKANFAFPMTQSLNINIGYSWRYNGEAFVGVPPIKRELTTGISYSF